MLQIKTRIACRLLGLSNKEQIKSWFWIIELMMIILKTCWFASTLLNCFIGLFFYDMQEFSPSFLLLLFCRRKISRSVVVLVKVLRGWKPCIGTLLGHKEWLSILYALLHFPGINEYNGSKKIKPKMFHRDSCLSCGRGIEIIIWTFGFWIR